MRLTRRAALAVAVFLPGCAADDSDDAADDGDNGDTGTQAGYGRAYGQHYGR